MNRDGLGQDCRSTLEANYTRLRCFQFVKDNGREHYPGEDLSGVHLRMADCSGHTEQP